MENLARHENRILTIIGSPFLIGGTPTKVLQLATYSKFEHFIFFTSGGGCAENFDAYFAEFQKHAHCYDGRSCRYSFFRLFFRISDIISEQKIDIIHTYFVFETLLALALKLRHPKVKLVIAFVSLVKTKSALRRLLMNTALRFASGVIFISKAVQKMRTEEFPLLNRKDCRIIYNGARPKPVRGLLDLDRLLPGMRFRILYTGGFNELKNHDVLIEAMRIICRERHVTDIGCVLIGGHGPTEPAIREKIEKYGLERQIALVGPSDDVGGALAAVQLYVHPAISEGFGIAVAEAMLSGCPVLLADIGALPELIRDGVEGMLVSPTDPGAWADRILELYRDDARRAAIGAAARKHAEAHFGVARFIADSDAYYEHILGRDRH